MKLELYKEAISTYKGCICSRYNIKYKGKIIGFFVGEITRYNIYVFNVNIIEKYHHKKMFKTWLLKQNKKIIVNNPTRGLYKYWEEILNGCK